VVRRRDEDECSRGRQSGQCTSINPQLLAPTLSAGSESRVSGQLVADISKL
jgi:hypothetical protein